MDTLNLRIAGSDSGQRQAVRRGHPVLRTGPADPAGVRQRLGQLR